MHSINNVVGPQIAQVNRAIQMIPVVIPGTVQSTTAIVPNANEPRPMPIIASGPLRPMPIIASDPLRPMPIIASGPLRPMPIIASGPLRPMPIIASDPLRPMPIIASDPLRPMPIIASGPLRPMPIIASDPLRPMPIIASDPLRPMPIIASGPLRPMPIIASDPLRPMPIIVSGPLRPGPTIAVPPVNMPVAQATAVPPVSFRGPVARPITLARTAEPLVSNSPMIYTNNSRGDIMNTLTGGIMKALTRKRTTAIQTPIAVLPVMTSTPVFTLVQETEETLLYNLSTLWPSTEAQLQLLLAARYQDGTNIISLKRRDIIMEIIGMIIRNNFDITIEFIQAAPNPEFILWDQSAMAESHNKLAREISVQQLEEIGTKSGGKCRYCASKELVFSMVQNRSGDEAMTVFWRCVLCKKQWRQ